MQRIGEQVGFSAKQVSEQLRASDRRTGHVTPAPAPSRPAPPRVDPGTTLLAEKDREIARLKNEVVVVRLALTMSAKEGLELRQAAAKATAAAEKAKDLPVLTEAEASAFRG